MTKTEHCVQEDALVLAAHAGGIEEVRISQGSDELFTLSVKIKTKRERFYLATRRTPGEPRKFKRVDVALSVGNKLFGVKKFIVAVL
jgi:hypothetical protein